MNDDRTDIVHRLIDAGDKLSLEAAAKITSLRSRGKYWEKECKKTRAKWLDAWVRIVALEKAL